MNIILFYEHVVRELDGCQKIIKELHRLRNIKVSLYSLIFEYYEATNFAKNNKIDIIVMPWLYSDKDYELVMPFIKYNPDVYIVNLHQEQIGSVISDGAVIPRGRVAKNTVIHFVWGENFKKILLDCGVKKELIYVTGNIRTDSLFEDNKVTCNREHYGEKYNLDLQKKWILYCENRDWVWANKKNMSIVYTKSGCSKKDFQGFYEESLQSINKTIYDIKSLGDNFFKKFEIIYRPHPGTLQQKKFDTRIHVISEESIYDWLQVVDANIVSGSTTIFESELCGVPSFVDDSFHMNERYQTYGVHDYPKIQSINEITEELIRKTQKNMLIQKRYEKYLGVADGKVAKRIAVQILEIIDKGVLGYQNSSVRINKLRVVMKYFREKVIKLLVKSNLLEILHWPRIAYRMRNDIPYRNNK